MPTGVIRKPKPGLTELGGLTRVYVYETSQFKDDEEFPYRGSIINNIQWTKTYTTGQLLGTVPSLNYNIYAAKLDGKYPYFLVKQNSSGLFKWGTAGYLTYLAGLFTPDPSFNVADITNFGDEHELSLAIGTLGSLSFLGYTGLGLGGWTAYSFGTGSMPEALPVIVNGELVRLNPKPLQNSTARIIFDVKEAEGKSDGKTSATQFSFLHSLMGKVAGYTKEKYATVDTYMGKDLLLIIRRPNGDHLFLGSYHKPMRMQISDALGKEADAYVGSDISFTQVDAVDFRPPLLAARPIEIIGFTAIPAYT